MTSVPLQFFESACSVQLLPPETPLSFPGNRIGLFGGSFNPPHRGHLEAASAALKRLQLDQVWWLVTPGNPLKAQDDLAPLAERLAACRALIDDRRMIVTGFERHLRSRYTVDTIAALVLQRPETRFVWVMGGDGWVEFHRWRRWQDIVQALPIAIVDRPNCRLKAMASRAASHFAQFQIPEHEAGRLASEEAPAWCYLTAPQNPLSSTQLRHASSH